MIDFGFSTADAVKFATANPARVMHYSKKGHISPGYDGDIIITDKQFAIKLVLLCNENIVRNSLCQ